MYDILNFNAKIIKAVARMLKTDSRATVSAGRYVTAFDNDTASKRTGEPLSCMSYFLNARNDIRGETIQPRQVTSMNLA